MIIIIALIVTIFYLVLLQERFTVHEEKTAEQPLLKDDLTYSTEFCAKKLTDLAYETHFLEKDIESEKSLLAEENILKEEEKKILAIKKKELSQIKREFEEYRSLCRSFEQRPTRDLCQKFIQEARTKLIVAERHANNSSGLEYIEIIVKDLRETKRIYENLQKHCNKLE